jgi:hypothetical protein
LADAKWTEADALISATMEAALGLQMDSMDLDAVVDKYVSVVHGELLSLFGTHEAGVSKPKRSNRDRSSSHEKKIKAEKAVLRKEHELWKSGKSTMSEDEVLSKSRRFHMLLKKHSKMPKMRNTSVKQQISRSDSGMIHGNLALKFSIQGMLVSPL